MTSEEGKCQTCKETGMILCRCCEDVDVDEVEDEDENVEVQPTTPTSLY